MPRLAVVPGNTIDDLVDKGLSRRMESYYNPLQIFDEVLWLSPFETRERDAFGMRVIPTKDRQLPENLKRLKVDIVRAYGADSPAEMAVFFRAKDVPVIVSVHDKRPEKIRTAIRFADVVFAVSEEIRDILLGLGVEARRIMVVPNGVDLSVMKPVVDASFLVLPGQVSFRYKILHVGRKSSEKNIEAILSALTCLGSDYGLVAVGQGDARVYEKIADDLGVRSRCVFLEGIPQADLPRFYSWADVVCIPSRSEAMCNVLIEALACGAAVVATETAAQGLGEIPRRQMLLLKDPEDVQGLTGTIQKACTDLSEQKRLKEKARSSVMHLSLERTRAHEANCYQQVLKLAAEGSFRQDWKSRSALWAAGWMIRLEKKLKRGGVWQR